MAQKEEVSSGQAVLLGALAPGVNAPTWNVIKITFLTLGVCLSAMLGLAFTSSDSAMIIHVMLLVLITGVLFFLLSSFLAETGLVSVEHQMQEMGLASKMQNQAKTDSGTACVRVLAFKSKEQQISQNTFKGHSYTFEGAFHIQFVYAC